MAPSLSASRSLSPSLSYTHRSSISIKATRSNSSNAWSLAEDDELLSHRASGLNWYTISAEHFPLKTANACRKRHERLITRRNADAWDGKAKTELLATHYMQLRPEIWGPLGLVIREPDWRVVEAKASLLRYVVVECYAC